MITAPDGILRRGVLALGLGAWWLLHVCNLSGIWAVHDRLREEPPSAEFAMGAFVAGGVLAAAEAVLIATLAGAVYCWIDRRRVDAELQRFGVRKIEDPPHLIVEPYAEGEAYVAVLEALSRHDVERRIDNMFQVAAEAMQVLEQKRRPCTQGRIEPSSN